MVLAELEVFHSRPIAPTRRVALGRSKLPVSPAPGFGAILLGGVVAANTCGVDPELFDDLYRLTRELEDGRRVPQPRLRHRFQTDRVGLTCSTHRLLGEGEALAFELAETPNPAQNVLAAVYAAGQLEQPARGVVFAAIRRAMCWSGPLDGSLLAYLTGLPRGHAWSAAALADPVAWALGVLGLGGIGRRANSPTRAEVQRGFRDLLRAAHPDHGGSGAQAAERIAELTRARRILLAGSGASAPSASAAGGHRG